MEGAQVQRVQDQNSLWFVCGTDSLIILRSSEFTSTKCIAELNGAADASGTKSEIIQSLHCYQVQFLRGTYIRNYTVTLLTTIVVVVLSNYMHYYICCLSGDEREAGRAKPAMKKLE